MIAAQTGAVTARVTISTAPKVMMKIPITASRVIVFQNISSSMGAVLTGSGGGASRRWAEAGQRSRRL
ncbi:hypothetical protein GCM10008026_10710 [Chelatococcus composti]|nr:hypothetical protein GCM10008026_10710 [Chelatococcus composti]